METQCPYCEKKSVPIPVETDPIKGVWFLLFGLFPSPKRRDALCRICGKTFPYGAGKMGRSDRVVGFLLLVVCFIMVSAAIVMVLSFL